MMTKEIGPIARKILTAGRKHKPAGYLGERGEVWLARVLPSPVSVDRG